MRNLWPVLLFLFGAAPALAGNYHLDIERKDVSITGSTVSKITVNGAIPGPTLHFAEGEEVTVTVTNHMDETTSVHWHGLLLPGYMDGAPGFNGFPGIKPGETFTYRFTTRQSGTYWYHSHSNEQEQEGLYGSIVITPKGKDPVQADRDYVILLSDFTHESAAEIQQNLKMNSAYYNHSQRTLGDFIQDVNQKGLGKTLDDRKEWGEMRMTPTDLADVTGYTFLTNGKTPAQNWTGLFKKGEKVRLRFINASAMSIFDVRIPGLKMTVVAADGQDIEPVNVDEFRFGIAETYDVIVQPAGDKAYTIAAEPIDRTGLALATLAPREGMRGETPQQRERATLTMRDMGGMEHSAMDHSAMDEMESGWAKAGTPAGHKALAYEDLRALGTQPKTTKPVRDVVIRLGGNMERYIWTLNGKKFEDAAPITLNYGETVRLKFINDTMMAHPMHLHGMFMQLENGQSANKRPDKHTVLVPPGSTQSLLLTADEQGEWPIHCHLLFHMASGMMNTVIVGKPGEANAAPAPHEEHDMHGMKGHHHAH